MLNMQQDIEAFMKPAAIILLQSTLAKGLDVNRLQMGLNLARQMQLKEVLRPIAIKLVEKVCKEPYDLGG